MFFFKSKKLVNPEISLYLKHNTNKFVTNQIEVKKPYKLVKLSLTSLTPLTQLTQLTQLSIQNNYLYIVPFIGAFSFIVSYWLLAVRC